MISTEFSIVNVESNCVIIVLDIVGYSPFLFFQLNMVKKSDCGEGTLYWALVKQRGSNKSLGRDHSWGVLGLDFDDFSLP